jgi:N-acetyl-gamma-glutamyl-phosphate reductase
MRVRVVDISADFRIKDIATWENGYGTKHACPELVAVAVAVCPRSTANRSSARIVANPMLSDLSNWGFAVDQKASLIRSLIGTPSPASWCWAQGRNAHAFSEASDNFGLYGVPATATILKSPRA